MELVWLAWSINRVQYFCAHSILHRGVHGIGVFVMKDKGVFQSFERGRGGLRWCTLFVGGVSTRGKMLCLTKVREVAEARGLV
jgi:hypothetical protein